MQRIKAEARAAAPVLEAAIADFEAKSAAWDQAASAVTVPAGAAALVKMVKAETKPTAQRFGFEIKDARDIIKAQALIFDRPEVMSIDPGIDGIRMDILVPTLVKNGGTFEGYDQEIVKLFARNGITIQASSVDPHSHLSDLQQEILETILKPGLGTNYLDGYGTSGSDGDRGAKVSFAVKQGGLATAKTLIPQIQAAMKPYGFKTFGKIIEFDVQ